MFDIPTLSGTTDSFFVMAYDLDYSNWNQPPINCSSRCQNPVAPLTTYYWNDTAIAGQYLAVAPASKIILGVPYYGRNACVYTGAPNDLWYTPSPRPTSPRYLDSITTNGSTGVSNYQAYRDVHDAAGVEPWAVWDSSSYQCKRESYWDDAVSLGAKYDLVNRYNLRGAGIFTFDYGGPAAELWSSLADHFSKIPGAPTGVSACAGDGYAEVQWTAPSANGGPITSYSISSTPSSAGATVGAGSQTTVAGLTNGSSYAFTVTATNAYGSGPASNPSNTVVPNPLPGFPGQYRPQAPARILDTRLGLGGSRLGGGQSLDLQVLGMGGVPASGVSAVALNLTVTNPAGYGYLTAYPSGSCRPFTSNLNFAPQQTIPNLVLLPVGGNGKVSLYNGSGGAVDLVADVEGWVTNAVAGGAGRLTALAPSRVADSRLSQGFSTLGPGQTVTLDLGRLGPIPSSGVAAVALNLTVTNPRSSGYITAFPAGASQPTASNLNYGPGQTIAARALVQTAGAGESVSFYNGSSASTDLVVDLNGWFSDASGSLGNGVFTGLVPVRLLDTRYGTGGYSSPVPAQGTVGLQAGGQFGVPASASAVVLNLTVTDAGAPGYATVYPDGSSRATVSDLNWVGGQTIPNLVLVKLGANGKLDLFNGSSGSANFVADLVGWYS
jgi:hypothetical protein